MRASRERTSGLAIPLSFATALGGCWESPCLDAKEYDFADNPENTEVFYDEGLSPNNCYYPATNSAIPKLKSARIPLQFNVLYYEGIKIEDIKDGIRRDLAALNYAFDPLDVTFYPAGITEMKDNEVLDLMRNMGEDDSDVRLTRQYMWGFPKPTGFPVFYLPKTNENDGRSGGIGPSIYYATPDQNYEGSVQTGYCGASSTLAHEMGHILGLEHPFRPDGKGDGLSDTIDYHVACGIPRTEPLSDHVETLVKDGVCLAVCADTCEYLTPVNVMDNLRCAEDLPQRFSPEQERILNCALQDPKNHLSRRVNQDFPKVDL